MSAIKTYSVTDDTSVEIPTGFERISLVQESHGEAVFYQVEDAGGDFYLCDADGDKVTCGEWTLLRVLADVPAADSDAFFEAIAATACQDD